MTHTVRKYRQGQSALMLPTVMASSIGSFMINAVVGIIGMRPSRNVNRVYWADPTTADRTLQHTDAVTPRILSCRVGWVKIIKVGILAFEGTQT